MEFLVLLLLVSNIGLVFSDDNATPKSSSISKDSYKVHPEPEDSQNDQVAESSHFITQNYNNGVSVQSHSQVSDQSHGTSNLESLRGQATSENNLNVVHPDVTQTYTNQQPHSYIQHTLQPIRILGAEMSPLRQTHEDESHGAIGYSSYVEHVSQRDEDEIKSALKEGSVNDLKRLVPKSGISFKIYHNKENAEPENKNPALQQNSVIHLSSKATGITQKPRVQYQIKTEAPGAQLQIKAPLQAHPVHELSSGIENHQQALLSAQTGHKQFGYEHSQQLLHSGGSLSQNEHGHPFYSQSDVSSQKAKLQLSSGVQFQKNLGGEVYSKGRTPIYNTVAVKDTKHLSDISNLQYQKQLSYDSKLEGSQKAVKKLKPLTSTHHSIDPLAQAEKNRERKNNLAQSNVVGSSHTQGLGLGSFGQNSATASHGLSHFAQISASGNGHALNQGLGNFGQNSVIAGTHTQQGAIGSNYIQNSVGGSTHAQNIGTGSAIGHNSALVGTLIQNGAVGNTYTQNSIGGGSQNLGIESSFGHNSAAGGGYIHSNAIANAHALNNEHKHQITTAFSEAAKINKQYLTEIKNNQKVNELLFNKAYTEHKALFPGNTVNIDNIKLQQNQVISSAGTNVHGGQQTYKSGLTTGLYSDSETAKTNHHELVSHVGQSFTEAKPSQDNFDHQKALEGSTSFDIKNAIDSGSLTHQTQYVAPEGLHTVGDFQKQQLTYVLPKIPAPVFIDNSVHETPVLEGHQIKDFGSSTLPSPHLSYSIVSAPQVSGKFIHSPQTLLWNSEALKQGTEFHQPLVKLHLPKEEIHQHVKTSAVELPTSTFSHISYPQHKQPYVLHYDVPVVKYTPDVHFQPKTKTKIQVNQHNQVKLSQPVGIDWSLFKNTVPNFNVNSLAVKPEFVSHVPETGKKIVPILVRKRKNRSNSKKEIGVIYGKVNMNRRPAKPSQRQEKNVQINLLPEASNNVRHIEGKGDKKNEFSVSASYKVDRSFKLPNSS